MNRPAEDPQLTGALPLLHPQPISTDVLKEKYLKDDETSASELFDRVARALASVEKPELRAEYEQKFRRNLATRFPAARVERIVALCNDPQALAATPVHEFMDLLVI